MGTIVDPNTLNRIPDGQILQNFYIICSGLNNAAIIGGGGSIPVVPVPPLFIGQILVYNNNVIGTSVDAFIRATPTLISFGAETNGGAPQLPVAFMSSGITAFTIQVDSMVTYNTGQARSVRSVMTPTALSSSDNLVLCDCTGGSFIVTLPLANQYGAGFGQILTVKRTDSSANSVTIQRQGSDTIDGATTKVLTVANGAGNSSLELESDGVSVWRIVKGYISTPGGGGTVTSVAATGTRVTGTVTNATTTPSIALALAATTVTAGAYKHAALTVQADGTLTAAANGNIGASTQVLFNASSDIAGDAAFTFDSTAKRATIGGGVATGSQILNTQSGSTYSVQASDNGGIILLTNATSVVVTIPSGLVTGFTCMFVRQAAGTVTFAASGTTVNSAAGAVTISAQYGAASLVSTASNVFTLMGSLA